MAAGGGGTTFKNLDRAHFFVARARWEGGSDSTAKANMADDDPLAHIKAELLRLPNISQSYASFMDELQGFYHAVSWSQEPWLQAVLAMHVLLLLSVFLTRRAHYVVQFALFFLEAALIAGAQTLNSLAAQHWRSFSTQNYFDPRGVFAGVVYAGPLLCIFLVHLVLLIKNSADLVVVVKRKELAANAARRAAAAALEKKNE